MCFLFFYQGSENESPNVDQVSVSYYNRHVLWLKLFRRKIKSRIPICFLFIYPGSENDSPNVDQVAVAYYKKIRTTVPNMITFLCVDSKARTSLLAGRAFSGKGNRSIEGRTPALLSRKTVQQEVVVVVVVVAAGTWTNYSISHQNNNKNNVNTCILRV